MTLLGTRWTLREPEGGPYDAVKITGVQKGSGAGEIPTTELVLTPEAGFASPLSADTRAFVAAYAPKDDTLDVDTELALIDRRADPVWETA